LNLPNADQAIIAPDKLEGYLLSPQHKRGGSKSAFFAALGYTRDNWRELEEALRHDHLGLDAEEVESTEWGRMFVIVGPLTGATGERAMTTSIWIIRTGEDTPRFVTAYPAR
jgi:hypothetical protein